ncbi:MAG TPA: thiamine diphosphokinase [Acidimicrobiaceae bacterium]|nr:thiamine diphosphokinase [Acidimicrobiaceae bacterium]
MRPDCRVLIVASASPEQLIGIETRPDVVIAADSGLHALLAAGWIPDRLIGDLDSADPSAVQIAAEGGAVVDRYPVGKNETDLELALAAAVDAGATEIRVVVRSDGRLDHQLANLFALAKPDWSTAEVRANVGDHVVWVVRGERRLEVEIGQHLALLPIGGPARLTTCGVAFPLANEVLSAFDGRGIANEATESVVSLGSSA